LAKQELSLQKLYNMILEKADKNHTHKVVGVIENALKFCGLSIEKFLRTDLKEQKIKTNQNSTGLTVESNNSLIKFVAGNNKNYIVAENNNLDTNNLFITGRNNEKVIISLNGDLLINGQSVTGIQPSTPSQPSVPTSITYSAPVGSIIQMITHSVPSGYIEANGDELMRDKYPNLFNFAYTQTNILNEEDWQEKFNENNNVDFYSKGDELITFRVPNLITSNNVRFFIKY